MRSSYARPQRRPPPRRARAPRASSRAGRLRPSTSEHGPEPDAWGRQDARSSRRLRARNGAGQHQSRRLVLLRLPARRARPRARSRRRVQALEPRSRQRGGCQTNRSPRPLPVEGFTFSGHVARGCARGRDARGILSVGARSNGWALDTRGWRTGSQFDRLSGERRQRGA